MCCAYSFMMVSIEKGEALEYMFKARYAFIVLYVLVGGTILMTTCVAGMAFAVSDQLAIYTISETVLSYTVAVLIPFAIMTAMTTCAYNMRYYEIYDEDMDFP